MTADTSIACGCEGTLHAATLPDAGVAENDVIDRRRDGGVALPAERGRGWEHAGDGDGARGGPVLPAETEMTSRSATDENHSWSVRWAPRPFPLSSPFLSPRSSRVRGCKAKRCKSRSSGHLRRTHHFCKDVRCYTMEHLRMECL